MAKNLAVIKSAGLGESVEEQISSAWEKVRLYKELMSKANRSAKVANRMLDDILSLGLKFQAGEKVFKLALGMILSAVKSTTDPGTYQRLCQHKFAVTIQTADRYALVYDAWLSGEFLYTLPEGYNFMDLSMRDLETGADLIVMGDLDNDAVLRLFGDGDWMTKREMIRDENPQVVKRKRRDIKQVSRRFVIESDGELYWIVGNDRMRFGHLLTGSPDATIQTVSRRAMEALKKEFSRG